jgi:hypothetical protein
MRSKYSMEFLACFIAFYQAEKGWENFLLIPFSVLALRTCLGSIAEIYIVSPNVHFFKKSPN